MAIQHLTVFYILVLAYLLTFTRGLKRSDFPTAFIFGAGSSAYQYEGAANEDGKGHSIWDTFTWMHPEKILDHSTADVAEDFYHHYMKDIGIMKEIGLESFRFSISWSRVLPLGKINRGVNQEGVKFYNNLINNLLSNGIQPFVTLLHFDPPQALEDEYGGCLSPNIVKDYCDYADFCFKEFGDRVKYWATMNEPVTFTSDGYATGDGPPARCSHYVGNCAAGNSGTEPYLVIHHLLLSHAAAVKLYREKYQDSQKGKIGITVGTTWIVPKYPTTACRKAASRALDFKFGWIVHPVTYGDYPESMQCIVGDRLPKFTTAESNMLRGSIDFLGVNYYTANYAEDSSTSPNVNLSYTTDSHVTLSTEKNGIPIGQPTTLSWFFVYPEGIRELVLYVKRKYNNPPIYITENGYGENSSVPIEYAIKDTFRIAYFRLHLSYLLKAIKDGGNVKGYYAWSFLDDFEWEEGYTIRFGITFVDFRNELKRYMKHSALWLNKFLQEGNATTIPLLYSE